MQKPMTGIDAVRSHEATLVASGGNGKRSNLSKAQRQPFIKIASKVLLHAGSIRKAAVMLGINHDVFAILLRDERLTSGEGHKILAHYRAIKHQIES